MLEGAYPNRLEALRPKIAAKERLLGELIGHLVGNMVEQEGRNKSKVNFLYHFSKMQVH